MIVHEDAELAHDALPRDAENADAIVFPDAAAPDALIMDAMPPPDSGADAGVEARMLRDLFRAEQVDSEIATAPQVELFASKDGVVAWQQRDFESMLGTDIHGNFWTTAAGWYPLDEVIDGLLTSPDPPRSVADPSGKALVVWTQEVGAQRYVNADFYDPTTQTWDGARPIYGLYQNPVSASLHPGFDSNNTPLVAFEDEAGTNIWVAHYDPAMNVWNEAAAADAADNAVASVVLAGDSAAWIDASAKILRGAETIEDNAGTIRALRSERSELIYLATDAQHDTLWARIRAANGMYGAREKIAEAAPNSVDADTLLFASGARGDSIAVWKTAAGFFASVRFAATTYHAPEMIGDADQGTPRALVVDPQGHAMLVSTTNNDAVEARRFFGGAWMPAMAISGPGNIAHDPDVAVDPDGDIMFVWSEREPKLIIDSIWTRRWD